MLKKNKTQTDQIENLKVKLNELEVDCTLKKEQIANWTNEKEELTQQKLNLKDELYSYMNRLSELEIHKENIELEHHTRLKTNEDKLSSIMFSLDEKDSEINKLKKRIDELNDEFESKKQAEYIQMKLDFEQDSLVLVRNYESQIILLKDEIVTLKVKIKLEIKLK